MYRKKPHITVKEGDVGTLTLVSHRGGDTVHCVVATKADNLARSGDRSPNLTLICSDGSIRKIKESEIESFCLDKDKTKAADVLLDAADDYKDIIELNLKIRGLRREVDELRQYLDPAYIRIMYQIAQQ